MLKEKTAAMVTPSGAKPEQNTLATKTATAAIRKWNTSFWLPIYWFFNLNSTVFSGCFRVDGCFVCPASFFLSFFLRCKNCFVSLRCCCRCASQHNRAQKLVWYGLAVDSGCYSYVYLYICSFSSLLSSSSQFFLFTLCVRIVSSGGNIYSIEYISMSHNATYTINSVDSQKYAYMWSFELTQVHSKSIQTVAYQKLSRYQRYRVTMPGILNKMLFFLNKTKTNQRFSGNLSILVQISSALLSKQWE